MTRPRTGSVTHALTRSLLVGLSLLWLAGVFSSGLVLKRLIDGHSDDELMESAAILMSLVSHTEDLLVTAALLAETKRQMEGAASHERLVYQVLDAPGRVLLRSHNAPAELSSLPLRTGLADVGAWRVATVTDAAHKHFLQLADPLSERRDALVVALAWLMLPLAALMAFAVLIVLRASRELVAQVQKTAHAVSRQDPQALRMLSLDDVATEMRPAIEATNRLLARLAAALEAERTFTYNSAHELRTPIAAALAQAQLLNVTVEGSALRSRTEALVGSLVRLSRLAERLLALARAEGSADLSDHDVDLARVVELVVEEFARSPALEGRRIVAETSEARVRGDLDAVGLAMRNLVENALVHGRGATTIRVACKATDRMAWIGVADDGPGITGTGLSSMVKRFARGPGAAGDGAGLGLAIADTLAKRMRAKLVLRSPVTGQHGGFDARIVWRA